VSFKHTATIDGVTFTRVSQSRTYTHCIVVKVRLTDERAVFAQGTRQTITDRFTYYTEVIAGGHKMDRAHLYRLDRVFNSSGRPLEEKYAESDKQADESDARQMAEALEYVKNGIEERIAKELADYDARIAKSKQISSDGKYHYLGGSEWCGRPGLADKALAQWMKRGEVAIAVPATFVETKPRAKK
jgi:hypothetical protein